MNAIRISLSLALALLSSLAIADPPLPAGNYTYHAIAADGYSGVRLVVAPPPPPTACPSNSIGAVAVSYGVVSAQTRTVSGAEWSNIWGYSNATGTGVSTPFPGNNGAGPVLRNFQRSQILCAHFHTPKDDGKYHSGQFDYSSFFAGPPIDITISRKPGDFSVNPANTGAGRFGCVAQYDLCLQWQNRAGNAGYTANLLPDTDYWLNVRVTGGGFGPAPVYLVHNFQ